MPLNKKRARIDIVTLLVISSLALWTVPAIARSRPGKAPSSVSAATTIRIDNFGRINGNYYRGAQPKNGDYADLAALGVKTLIDLTGSDGQTNEQAMAERAGMSYVHIPMTTHVPPSGDTLTQFLAIVNDPALQPVYVHCVGGRHRTGVMTAAYRMSHDGWTADQAFNEMKQYKFGADALHREFKQFVYAYHAQLVTAATAPALAARRRGD